MKDTSGSELLPGHWIGDGSNVSFINVSRPFEVALMAGSGIFTGRRDRPEGRDTRSGAHGVANAIVAALAASDSVVVICVGRCAWSYGDGLAQNLEILLRRL
jgi:hypothetical protein